MNSKELQEISLFKFSLIAPIINDTYEASSQMEFFRNTASKTYIHPNGNKVKYSAGTIKGWHISYKQRGIDGLMPKKRNDAGLPRSFSEEAVIKIHDIKEKYPYITTKMVYQKLVEDGYIKESKVSLSSVYRYIRENNLKRNQLIPIERKAFEMEFSNDCWQADTSHGPKIMINGRKVQTYLISIIDDKSRLIVHAEFFLHDNSINLQSVLKKAIKKYGICKKLFVDNGKPYKNIQFNLICASVGITLIYSRPYSPESKGKILYECFSYPHVFIESMYF